MKIKNFIEKLQNLPDNKKKIVLWTIVAVLAVVMGYFWIVGTINNLSKVGNEIGQIKIPNVPTPINQP